MGEQRFDPQQARAALERTLAAAPAQLADGFARVVRGSPQPTLEQVMRTPVRRLVLDGIFWQMPQHLNRTRARGVSSVVAWHITGRADGGTDVYHLVIDGGRCRTTRDPAGVEPRLTITVDAVEFIRIATGNSNPAKAYFRGDVRLAGDLMLAAKLISLFRVPAPPSSQGGV
jgi:putative sterol carrier protein